MKYIVFVMVSKQAPEDWKRESGWSEGNASQERSCTSRQLLNVSEQGTHENGKNGRMRSYQLFKFLMHNLLKAKDKQIILNKKFLE
jgi:hypothetical protein